MALPGIATRTTVARTGGLTTNRPLANGIFANNVGRAGVGAAIRNAASFTGLYTPFVDGDVIANQQEEVTKGLWSNNVGTLTTFFTSSTETATQKTYYYEVFQSASTTETAAPQFSVAYGHINGSGSAESGTSYGDYSTKAIYSQYRQLLLEPNDSKFTFNGTDSNHIYVININRARMRERIDEGNFELSLAALTGSTNPVVSASSTPIKLIDDSTLNTATVNSAGKVYNLVSGTIANGVYNSSAPHYYGLFYPQHGIAVLNADTLNLSASFSTNVSSNTAGDNAFRIFTSISGAASNFSLGFKARSAEQVKSTYYFVRVKNLEYNYSNNPSYVTGSEGELAQATFVTDPKVYITSVGLYNDRQELLAVAKLSKPLMKSFTREANIKVKLDF